MAVVVILNFKKTVAFLYYATRTHQIWWAMGNLNVECIFDVAKMLIYQSSRWRYNEFKADWLVKPVQGLVIGY